VEVIIAGHNILVGVALWVRFWDVDWAGGTSLCHRWLDAVTSAGLTDLSTTCRGRADLSSDIPDADSITRAGEAIGDIAQCRHNAKVR
jgi:hypothetical protein